MQRLARSRRHCSASTRRQKFAKGYPNRAGSECPAGHGTCGQVLPSAPAEAPQLDCLSGGGGSVLMARKAQGPWRRAKLPQPIPPRSVVELVRADNRTPTWRRQIGRRFRIGYYSPQDGLDTVWLVDDVGTYCQTADQASMNRSPI